MFFFTPSSLLDWEVGLEEKGPPAGGGQWPGSFYWSLCLAAAVSADVVFLCNVIFLGVYSA